MQYHGIDEIIEEIRAGRPVVIVDDEDRENEGDVVFAAEKTTPELINFMARYARGLICMPLTESKCKQLNLPLMVPVHNGTKFGTNFTVSIEAASGVTTGISAYDRATTILAAANPEAKPQDIVQPGHIFPIMAKPGGVLARAGHTEASTDLARLAGLSPVAVLCEILNDDGTMSRGEELFAFCERHQLKIGTIADLIAYRLQKETTVYEIQSSEIETDFGAFTVKVFRDEITGLQHYCFMKGQPDKTREALIRVHVHDPILDLPVFSPKIENRWSITEALEAIAVQGHGAFILLSQQHEPTATLERIGLMAHQQTLKKPAIPQAHSANLQTDVRLIGVGSQLLSLLGYGKIRVLGSEKRYYGLSGFGLTVVGFSPKD